MRVWLVSRVVMHNKFVGLFVASFVLAVPTAEARRDNQYLIPPPPPTPALMVPPPPVALPYSQAYANYKAPAQMVAPQAVLQQAVQQPVRMRPNLTGLSLVEAQARGFGKPRVPYNVGFGPGAALATPYTSATAMNTWFDSSLQWYSNHLNASAYYDSMAAQAPYFKPDAPSPVVAKKQSSRKHFKRVIADK